MCTYATRPPAAARPEVEAAPDLEPTEEREPPDPELAPLLALSGERLDPEAADQRYLSVLRASGATAGAWVREAYTATDGMRAGLSAREPGLHMTELECHAAGCTFTLSGAGGFGDRVSEVGNDH